VHIFRWIRHSCCGRFGTKQCLFPEAGGFSFEAFVAGVIGVGTKPGCRNDHWFPQSERIDDLHWPLLNFVGHMETLEQDAKLLLERIGAWRDYGASGWGSNGTDPVFSMANREGRHHAHDAARRMEEYYRLPQKLIGGSNSTANAPSSSLFDRVMEYYRSDYSHPILAPKLDSVYSSSSS